MDICLQKLDVIERESEDESLTIVIDDDFEASETEVGDNGRLVLYEVFI